MRHRIISLVLVAIVVPTAGCFRERREHRECRQHEHWERESCRADVGYEHYWDSDRPEYRRDRDRDRR